MSVAMRTTGEPSLMLATVRREVKAIEPDVPVYDAATMEQRLSKSLSAPRAASSLVGGFAVLAMVLALAGLYGVIAYSVAQRTRELGVRMALGATRRDVISLVLRQGMMPALAGVVGGLLLAFALTRTLGSLLYGVAPHDAPTFVLASLALLVLAGLACAIPARSASRLNPVTALRLD
ncbi:MAG: FtsX-like permease family protein, partial [Gemmatimonadaceae bacterium]